MEVDASAPAVARAEIAVSAPRDVVLTEIETWPS
jgi:hypothetical protein